MGLLLAVTTRQTPMQMERADAVPVCATPRHRKEMRKERLSCQLALAGQPHTGTPVNRSVSQDARSTVS